MNTQHKTAAANTLHILSHTHRTIQFSEFKEFLSQYLHSLIQKNTSDSIQLSGYFFVVVAAVMFCVHYHGIYGYCLLLQATTVFSVHMYVWKESETLFI